MPYVKRDGDGNIVAVGEQPDEYFSEEVDQSDMQLRSFLYSVSEQHSIMGETDLNFIRVVEDLIEVLISKNYLRFTDLPPEAQAKIRIRQSLRNNKKNDLDLLSEDDEGFF